MPTAAPVVPPASIPAVQVTQLPLAKEGLAVGVSPSGPPDSVRIPTAAPATITNPAAPPAPPPMLPTTSVAVATSPATPEAAATTPSLDDAKLFINREVSWLAFNERVITEGRNPVVPMLERLKFVS